jgi:Na+-translocating ferredoxin:NAD+ oxidoreductase RnfA subunit
VDVALGGARWNRQTWRDRIGVVAVYVITALGLWAVTQRFLIPLQAKNLSAQVYVFTSLGLFGFVKWLSGGKLWNHSERKAEPLLHAVGVLTLLGIPFLSHTEHTPLAEYLLAAVGAGVGWLAVSYIISTIGEELRSANFPALLCGRGGLLIVSGLMYWALMGFFNVRFI